MEISISQESKEIMYYVGTGKPSELWVSQYPGGEPLVTFDHDQLVDTILLRPRTLQSFVTAMFWVEAMKERASFYTPHLYLPYIPGARQDRINPTGDYLFTLKSIAKMINAQEFEAVYVLDPHSDVAPALIDRCVVADATTAFIDRWDEGWTGVIAPDAGAEKRAAHLAKKLMVPVYHGWKNRDMMTGKLSGFGVEDLPAGHYLVVDDICDGGGTFVGLAEEIAKYPGATADLYVTHGIFSQGTEKLFQYYHDVYCTDSVLTDKPLVTVIPYCEDTRIW